jgi:chromosome partitioning protein
VSRIIFTNQKGGVGKTTLTREVGITLSELGMRVLLVDCDPQGNLSKSFEVEASGLYDGLTGGEAIVHHINNR